MDFKPFPNLVTCSATFRHSDQQRATAAASVGRQDVQIPRAGYSFPVVAKLRGGAFKSVFLGADMAYWERLT